MKGTLTRFIGGRRERWSGWLKLADTVAKLAPKPVFDSGIWFGGALHRIVTSVPPRAFTGRESPMLAIAGDCTRWSREQWSDFWGDWRAQAVPQAIGAQLMSVIPASFFQTPDWIGFANELKGVQEVVRWPLYSYLAYPAAGSVNLLFFATAEGQATNGRLDTNLTGTGGQLPGNQMFVGVGLGVEPWPAQADIFAVNAANGLAAQQWYNVLTQGWVEVRISGKEYLVAAPLIRFPAGFGFGSVFTAGAIAANLMNMAFLNNGSPDNRAKYNLDPPLGILPMRPFEARTRWNAVQAVATAGRIGTAFEGWLIRAVL